MTRMDEPLFDPEWIFIKYIKITKYNRITTVLKGEFKLLKDMIDGVKVSTTYNLLFTRILSFIPFNLL